MKKSILIILVFIMLSINVNALCWNPLELFCIFGDAEIQVINTKNNTKYEFDNENITLSLYAVIDGEKELLPIKSEIKDNKKFGFVLNESEINDTLKLKNKQNKWDKKVYMEIEGIEEYYYDINNPYSLKRELTPEENKLFNEQHRFGATNFFLDFSDIFEKEGNVKNDSNFSLYKENDTWIAEFYNIYDLDPQFSTNAIDTIDVAPLNETHFVIAWCDQTEDDYTVAVYNSNGDILISATDFDLSNSTTACSNNERQEIIAVSSFNFTDFVIGYSNRSSNSLSNRVNFVTYHIEGTQLNQIAKISIDLQSGYFPVDVSTFNETHFVIAWGDDDGTIERYEFAIYDIYGNQNVGVTEIDGGDLGANIDGLSISTFNSSSFVAGYYDSVLFDAKIRTFKSDGTAISGVITIDSDIRGGSHIKVATINNTDVSIAYVDDRDLTIVNVTYAIYDINGNAKIPSTMVDTDVDDSSELRLVVIDIASINESSFIPLWTNEIDSGKIYKIYDVNGNILKDKTNISSVAQTGSQVRALSVTSRQTGNNISFCNGGMVFAWVETISDARWSANYSQNGTAWDGKCGGVLPPPTTCSQCSDINDGDLDECKGKIINFNCDFLGNRLKCSSGGAIIAITARLLNWLGADIGCNMECYGECT